MEKRVNKIFWLLVSFLVFLIFRSWFGLREISSGDTGFYFPETLKDFSSFPYLWIPDGLGSYSSLLYYFPYLVLPLKLLSLLGLPWILIERVVWYWPFLILGIFSSWYLAKTVLPEVRLRFLAPLVYLLNTYILMIVGGGQVSIFLPYAIAPLVLGLFIKLINYSIADYPTSPASGELRGASELRVKRAIMAGVVLAVQVCFEPRIAFITLLAIGIYLIIQLVNAHFAGFLRNDELRISNLIKNLGVPFAIAGLLHFYWILPSLVLRKASFSPTLASGGWAEFLSFARFSDSLSLLHPNWPENIFGKTYFFRPEFLILPILAFISLLFINELTSSRVKKNVLVFALLGLVGTFLAKGTNPPFGRVYLWLFDNIPGMNLFRDPTKFYVLVAISYSLLIPFSLEQIVKKFNKKFGAWCLVLGAFLIYWLLLIKPAILEELGGTFKTKEEPSEYLVLKEFIAGQEEFFRIFWVPRQQRFGFFSNNHPAISAENFLTDTVCLEPFCSLKVEMAENWGEKCFSNDRCYVRELSYFLNSQTKDVLAQMAVKYVIVPSDSEGEIFIAEHQYNPQQRKEVEEFLDTIPWLKKIGVAEKIAVYELLEFKDHFFGTDKEIPEIQWQMINPTKYKVQVENANQPFKLVFSETYDSLWQAKFGGETISSQPHMGILNSFLIDKTGDLEVVVELAGQKYVNYGVVISGIAFFTLLFYYLLTS